MSSDIFDSCVRTAGDLAGVFEYDGETGYFYLYDVNDNATRKILDTIHVLFGKPDFNDTDVSIRWDSTEEKVGLVIHGALWAVFDTGQKRKHGARYKVGTRPSLPSEATVGFDVDR